MINTKIEQILDTFGMSGKKAAEIMGMTPNAFRQKMHEINYNKFTKENLADLTMYIQSEALKLR